MPDKFNLNWSMNNNNIGYDIDTNVYSISSSYCRIINYKFFCWDFLSVGIGKYARTCNIPPVAIFINAKDQNCLQCPEDF